MKLLEKIWVRNIFEKTGKQHVEMLWICSTYGDIRWPIRIKTWPPEGRRRRGRPEVKWEKEVKRVVKQRNLTPDDAENRKLWRLTASNRYTAGKLIGMKE
jgi:hypothetical protein